MRIRDRIKSRIARAVHAIPEELAVELHRNSADLDHRLRTTAVDHAREIEALELRLDEARGVNAKLRAELEAERTAGAEIVIAAARSLGKLALLGDDRAIERLRRIACEDGIPALAAELAEMPAAAQPTSEALS